MDWNELKLGKKRLLKAEELSIRLRDELGIYVGVYGITKLRKQGKIPAINISSRKKPRWVYDYEEVKSSLVDEIRRINANV